MVISPGMLPITVGVNVIVMLQRAPAPRVEGDTGQVLLSLKSPLAVIEEISSAAVPLLVRVTDWPGLVVFTSCPGKVKLAGDKLTAGAKRLNVATTDWLEFMLIRQLPVPLQAPPQPVKTEPEAAAAVIVTAVPPEYVAVHDDGQAIPAGLLLTLPEPVPARLTLRVKDD